MILARGLGSRMRAGTAALSSEQRAAADAGQKGMMPVAGRPLLDYVLHELAEGGVRTVVFVVAPDETAIRERFTRLAPPSRVNVRFVVQAEPRGTADALLAARAAVGDAEFLMLNADNLYPAESVRALVELGGPGLIAFEGDALVAQANIPADRVKQYALLDLATDGTLRAVVEKPPVDHPMLRAKPRWVSMNLWRFDASIFDDCAAVRPSVRGELELVDAVRGAIGRGVRFSAVRQRVGVLDLTNRMDILPLESRLQGRKPLP